MDFMNLLPLALLFVAAAVSSAVLGAGVILIGLTCAPERGWTWIAKVSATSFCLRSLVFLPTVSDHENTFKGD